jgi:altronate hydrolase
MVCMASTSPIEQLAVLLHPDDNIAVARQSLVAGTRIIHTGPPINLRDAVKLGHKFALQPIECGSAVRKFGQIIGFASRDIAVGEHVHTHNVACGQYDRQAELAVDRPDVPAPLGTSTFEGFLRPDGRVGTRNYVAVVSTVNCSASTVDRIARTFTSERLRPYPNVDGVFAITHKTGCGMAGSGLDRDHLSRTLHGFSHHPNVFGYVLVGLGCEVNQANQLIEREQLLGRSSMPAPRVFTVQGEGSIAKTVARGVAAVEELLERANIVRRSTQPVSKLVLGTNCGGSDGNSGITANPALGYASDQIIAHGGTSILGETTEIYGAEHLLTRRAVSADVGRKLLERIRWWEWYTSLFNATIDNNPSFGNKEGGLTTIFEKSLGAIAKGGTTPLVDVVDYAQRVQGPGLVVMDTPGFDPVSVTGIVAGGATVMVFTTGRGSVLGCKPTPTIKVSTNTPLFDHMREEMDLDAGSVLAGRSIPDVGSELYEMVLRVASGESTKSEQQGLGDDEFAPWIVGPVL